MVAHVLISNAKKVSDVLFVQWELFQFCVRSSDLFAIIDSQDKYHHQFS